MSFLEKQTSIIQYICENVDIDALVANETSAMDVQGIIQQHLPELSNQAIDAAIGYEAICNRSTESVGNPTAVPIGMSGYLADELALPSELVADSSTGLEGFDADMVMLDGMQGAPSHYHLLPFSEGVGGMVFDFAYDDMDMGKVIG
ncbi:hypothetical protein BS50DRAFT_165354 [Corynespora cassiicola Philippines]|uniref:Uncharacterized protein n=1 Tax=Corynespora cassiicola Philippines TaxID=1448308 RepID=A0A2T2P4T2_CORCC|nr:hypothetical protein BS50DRAFT_165354 [Corynespora cassiicola Philippines]